jgi:diguanylate cyclase (GGDEF)-like protein
VDTVARYGGDEFVVVLSGLDKDKAASESQACGVAEKIRLTLAEPYVLTVQSACATETTISHQCTSSIGIVIFIDHELDPDDILKRADMAMYQAKETGRNLVRFYNSAA